MAAAPVSLPLKAQQLLQLPRLGFDASLIKFTNVSMSSDRCVVVRDSAKVSIVDTKSKAVTPLTVAVDAALMNPNSTSNVLALRGGTTLQIFNLDMKSRMKTFDAGEAVLYWKWLDVRTLAYVTQNAVFHWSMEGDSKPEKKFEIDTSDGRRVQYINYDASPDGNWLFLQGITKNAAGAIEGVLQLYSVSLRKYQPKMNAHGGCLVRHTLPGRSEPSTLFCFARSSDAGASDLLIVEVDNPDRSATHKVQQSVTFARAGDFIVNMIPSTKFGCLYALTQAGFLYVFDMFSGKTIFNRQVAESTMFLSVAQDSTGGVIAVDRAGNVVSLACDVDTYVPFITKAVGDYELGVRIATSYDLPGAGDVFQTRFKSLCAAGNWEAAAKLAAEAPRGALRTADTIRMFQSAPQAPSKPPVDMQFYQLLLAKGLTLNELESIELCRRVLQFKPVEGKARIEKFLKEGKLTNSEALGDLLAPHDPKLALAVYYRAEVPEKAILCFIQLGQSSKVVEYAKSVSYTPNWAELLARVQSFRRDDVKDFAQMISTSGFMTATEIVDALLGGGRSDVEKATEFLLDYLKERGDRKEDAELQTRLLEMNLRTAPQVAAAILESEEYKFTHYDRALVARLCESARLYQAAMEHYESLEDIKRVMGTGLSSAGALREEFLIAFFGDLIPDDALSCLRDILKYHGSSVGLQLVVKVALRYVVQLTEEKLIEMFEDAKSWNGLYLFLGSIVSTTTSSEVVFKYIQAATEMGQVPQVELICRENDYYDPEQVKAFLLESPKIKDPRPLIHVCDRHGFIEELTNYLYTNSLFRFIEVYVQKMNAGATPKVVGALLDLSAPEDQIRTLINTVRPPGCPVDELVAEVEKRTRITLLLPWLEARMHEGLEDPALHNALAKIYIDINNNPQHFLENNKFYDSAVVGEYCESRDPHLAFIAYRRAAGSCDKQLIDITNRHGFYKDQARYCVQRMDKDLWVLVLAEDNSHRRSLIDQVVSTALPESRNPDEVSATVRAFMEAELPNELIELLEKIVLSHSADYSFRSNKNLQNLLILTAIKADPSRVTGYIDRLDNYDGPEMAEVCISDEYKLYEEGFLIYKKFGKMEEAIKVLLEKLEDIERGASFAAITESPDVWVMLGKAQLKQLAVPEAIESFLKAKDPQCYVDVIAAVNESGDFKSLITFLLMARETVKDKTVDSELIYSYAKIEDLANLEIFLGSPHTANLDRVGDRCYQEGLYGAAKILFSRIANYAKLSATLVKLELYQEARDAAQRANNVTTWKLVCYACVDAGKFRLAQACGVNIIIFMDHLSDLIRHYEVGGHFAELISLLEQGVNLDRAHQGIYTQLGILYAKYKEKKLAEHINLFWSRLNIPTLLQACKDNLHWKETVTLYSHYGQYDNAVDTMIAHGPSCFEHELFKNTIIRVGNTEVYYRALNFYLAEHPEELSALLIELSAKLDHKRVVSTMSRSGNLALIQAYLLHIQSLNIKEVNESLNNLWVEEDNYQALRESIEEYDQFEESPLALRLEKHELLEFRRISAFLYRRNKRLEKSIALSKADHMWQDAMESAALSEDPKIAEDLLRFFVETEECPRSCFAACLYTCFTMIRADVVLELAWRHGLTEFAMPYMVQTFRDFHSRMDALSSKFDRTEKDAEDKKKEEDSEKAKAVEAVADQWGFQGPRAITYTPGGAGSGGIYVPGGTGGVAGGHGGPAPGMFAGGPPPGAFGGSAMGGGAMGGYPPSSGGGAFGGLGGF
jgi:clathrin heavy chain